MLRKLYLVSLTFVLLFACNIAASTSSRLNRHEIEGMHQDLSMSLLLIVQAGRRCSQGILSNRLKLSELVKYCTSLDNISTLGVILEQD